jgi:Spy/CpxP family protein refolding chaperone
MMTRRMKLGIVAGVLATLAGFGIVKSRAHAGWGHGGRHAIMKRMVNAHIDEVLDEAKVNPQQRSTIYAARDRVYSAFENSARDRKAHLEDALRLFEADRVDQAQVAALRAQGEAKHKLLADEVTRALIETHDVLTPQQRHVVAERVRAFRSGHGD